VKPPLVIGIDPGIRGAHCALMPLSNQVVFIKNDVKPIEIKQWYDQLLLECDLRVIMIENVHSIQGVSAKSNFMFGYNTGTVNAIAALTGSMVDLVNPKKWQKHIGVTAKGSEIKKNVASICERLYPNVSVRGPRGGLLDGMSDALMIAHYASQHHLIQTPDRTQYAIQTDA
jgi:hypothetical protein